MQDVALGKNGSFNSGEQSNCPKRNIAQNLATMVSTSAGVVTTALDTRTPETRLGIWFWAAAKSYVSS